MNSSGSRSYYPSCVFHLLQRLPLPQQRKQERRICQGLGQPGANSLACTGREEESQLPHQTLPAAADTLTRDPFCQLCYGDVISSREKIKNSWGLSHKKLCSSWGFVLSTRSFIHL